MLQITKEKVLEAAGKCPTAKAILEVLFPDVFRTEFQETHEIKVNSGMDSNSYGLFIGLDLAPKGLKLKCLMIEESECIVVKHEECFVIVPKKLEYLITPDMRRLK